MEDYEQSGRPKEDTTDEKTLSLCTVRSCVTRAEACVIFIRLIYDAYG